MIDIGDMLWRFLVSVFFFWTVDEQQEEKEEEEGAGTCE